VRLRRAQSSRSVERYAALWTIQANPRLTRKSQALPEGCPFGAERVRLRDLFQKQTAKNVPVGFSNPLVKLGDAPRLCPHSIQQRRDDMRDAAIRSLIVLAMCMAWSRLLAEEVPLEQLPRVVLETIDMEKGDGTAKSAESFIWGDTTIYKIEIDLNDAPELELHVAENGKLIRVDRLQPEMDDDQGE
jgi:hypothetical protein